MLHLQLRKPTGEEFSVQVHETDALQVVDVKLAEIEDIPSWAAPKWIHNGMTLDNLRKSFAHYGIQSRETLDFVLVGKQIVLKIITIQGKKLSTKMFATDSVHDLWQKILEKAPVSPEDYPVAHRALFCNKRALHDDQKLAACLKSGTVCHPIYIAKREYVSFCTRFLPTTSTKAKRAEYVDNQTGETAETYASLICKAKKAPAFWSELNSCSNCSDPELIVRDCRPSITVSRRNVSKGKDGKCLKDEAIYAVDVEHACRAARYRRSVSIAHLDVLEVNTGVCRQFLDSLNTVPLLRRFKTEWQEWRQWHPEAEPSMRQIVEIFGIPWHLAQQLGTIDTLLFCSVQPSLLEASVRQVDEISPGDLMKHIEKRATLLRVSDSDLSVRKTGAIDCIDITPKELSVMPDPWTATHEALAPYLPVQQGGENRLECLNIARWKYALEQKEVYLKQLLRPGYGNDLPFFSLVTPLPRRSWWFPDEPIATATSPVLDIASKLMEASWEAAQLSVAEIVQRESARISVIKSVKPFAEMPVMLWYPTYNVDHWEERLKPNWTNRRKPIHLPREPHGLVEIGWQSSTPDELGKADFRSLLFEPVLSWKCIDSPREEICSEDVNNAWIQDLRAERSPVVLLQIVGGLVISEEEIPKAAIPSGKRPRLGWNQSQGNFYEYPEPAKLEEERVAWSDDYTSNGWELLPEGVIAADIASETEMPVKPRKWKLPETWKTMILVPDDYTRDVAFNELQQRREAFRRERAAQYEELAQLGETLVQWPEQGFFPRQKVTATFNWLKVLKLLFDKDRKEKKFFLHNKVRLAPRPVRPPDISRVVYGRPSPGLSSRPIFKKSSCGAEVWWYGGFDGLYFYGNLPCTFGLGPRFNESLCRKEKMWDFSQLFSDCWPSGDMNEEPEKDALNNFIDCPPQGGLRSCEHYLLQKFRLLEDDQGERQGRLEHVKSLCKQVSAADSGLSGEMIFAINFYLQCLANGWRAYGFKPDFVTEPSFREAVYYQTKPSFREEAYGYVYYLMTGLHKLPSCTSILYRRGWGPTDCYVEKQGVKTFESYTLGSSWTFPMCLASSSTLGLKSSFDYGVECALWRIHVSSSRSRSRDLRSISLSHEGHDNPSILLPGFEVRVTQEATFDEKLGSWVIDFEEVVS